MGSPSLPLSLVCIIIDRRVGGARRDNLNEAIAAIVRHSTIVAAAALCLENWVRPKQWHKSQSSLYLIQTNFLPIPINKLNIISVEWNRFCTTNTHTERDS